MSLNVLITSPSLDMRRNVNGISAVVMVIMANVGHRFFPYRLGRHDDQNEGSGWVLGLLRQLLAYPFFVLRHRIDLVHQNFPFNAKGVLRESCITAMSRLLGRPVLLHVHGGEYLMNGCRSALMRRIARFTIQRARVVVVLSEVEKAALKSHFDIDGAEVLTNAVDVPRSPRERPLSADGKRTLLFLGRIHESKGVEDIVAALRVLYARRPFRFIACGAGPLQDQLATSCREFMGEDFEFAGVVSGEAKAAIVDRADVFLLPSRYGEGLPMAMLETMAAGVVPVVTDDASMKIVVQPGVNGLRVRKKDPADLAAQLETLLADSELMRRLSREAARTVREGYGTDRYAARLTDIYQRCAR